MNCSPSNPPCGDCLPEKVLGNAVAARDAEIAELRTALNTQAALDVLAERRRQIDREGYNYKNDDAHILGELGAYAAYYAMPPAARDWPATETGYGATWGEAIVPWNWSAPKPGDRRCELVKAAALLLAEVERIDRTAMASAGEKKR